MTHAGSPLPDPTLTRDARPDVEIRLPAQAAYVTVLRTAAAGLAARLDFTIDDVEDLRIVVGEASALLLPLADEGGDLSAAFRLGAGTIEVTVGVEARAPEPVDRDGFGWQVLTALATRAESRTDERTVTVTATLDSSTDG